MNLHTRDSPLAYGVSMPTASDGGHRPRLKSVIDINAFACVGDEQINDDCANKISDRTTTICVQVQAQKQETTKAACLFCECATAAASMRVLSRDKHVFLIHVKTSVHSVNTKMMTISCGSLEWVGPSLAHLHAALLHHTPIIAVLHPLQKQIRHTHTQEMDGHTCACLFGVFR